MNLEYIVLNLQKLNSAYSIGEPASAEQIAEAEQGLDVHFPAQVKMFYERFNGLAVIRPATPNPFT